MSIVPREGLLRKHFEEAERNIEYTSSAFWQAYFQRAFPEMDTYSVTAESSPDGSRRRADMVMKKYDHDHHTFTALLWIECKRPTGSIREVETQALDAALRCIGADNLLWIYAVTTVASRFALSLSKKALPPFNHYTVPQFRQTDDNTLGLIRIVLPRLQRQSIWLRPRPLCDKRPLCQNNL